MATLVGLWLMQSAFNAAPLHASLPAITAGEPAAGIILGVLVFGDKVHTGPWLLIIQLAGIAAVVAGVILVARAPVLSELSLRELPQVVRSHIARSASSRQPGRPDLDAQDGDDNSASHDNSRESRRNRQ